MTSKTGTYGHLRLQEFYDKKDRKHFVFIEPTKGPRNRSKVVHTWLASDPVGKCTEPGCKWESKKDLPPHAQYGDYIRHLEFAHSRRMRR